MTKFYRNISKLSDIYITKFCRNISKFCRNKIKIMEKYIEIFGKIYRNFGRKTIPQIVLPF